MTSTKPNDNQNEQETKITENTPIESILKLAELSNGITKQNIGYLKKLKDDEGIKTLKYLLRRTRSQLENWGFKAADLDDLEDTLRDQCGGRSLKQDKNNNQGNKLKELVSGILSNTGIFIFSLVYGIFSYSNENVSSKGKNSREMWIVRTFWIPPFFSILLWIIIDSPRICHYKINACIKPIRKCLIEYILAYACCLGCTERPETEVIAKALSARRSILSVIAYTVEGLVVGVLGIKSVAIASYLLLFSVVEIGTFAYELISMGRYPWSKEAKNLVHRAVELTSGVNDVEVEPFIKSEVEVKVNVENVINDDL